MNNKVSFTGVFKYVDEIFSKDFDIILPPISNYNNLSNSEIIDIVERLEENANALCIMFYVSVYELTKLTELGLVEYDEVCEQWLPIENGYDYINIFVNEERINKAYFD